MIRYFLNRAALGLLLALGCARANADTFPDHAIQVIVPYSAGGPTDAAARVMAQRLSERLGQAVTVVSMGGAGGVLGTDYVNRSKPDGYTLLFAVNSMAIFPYTRKPSNPLPFDPMAFVPVGGVSDSAHVLVASKPSNIHNLAELVAMAKEKPGTLSYGSAGVGGTTHLPLAFFSQRAGIKLLHVPYKGAAPAMSDTMAGFVQLSTPGYSGAVKEAIDNGTLTAIAVTSAKRLPFLPNVPTLAEQGYPDMVFPIWYGLFAPKGTPGDVVARLTRELKEMADEPAYQKLLLAQGNVATYLTPEQLGTRLRTDIANVGTRLKSAGLDLAE